MKTRKGKTMKKKTVNKTKASHPFEIGKQYLMRTVTNYFVGKLERVTAQEFVMSEASWVADTGRFYDSLRDGEFNEVEPIIGPVIIGRGSLVDCVEWPHRLPTEQK
jgi:hypothetical protein